jgi:hypothetical protein
MAGGGGARAEAAVTRDDLDGRDGVVLLEPCGAASFGLERE